MRSESVDERLQRMSERLNLSDEQKTKIRPILENEAKQMRELRENKSLSPEDRRAKTREIQRSTQERMDRILTREQREKMRETKEKGRGGEG
jgi:Spy/CpxP family protein refolding chaperone